MIKIHVLSRKYSTELDCIPVVKLFPPPKKKPFIGACMCSEPLGCKEREALLLASVDLGSTEAVRVIPSGYCSSQNNVVSHCDFG